MSVRYLNPPVGDLRGLNQSKQGPGDPCERFVDTEEVSGSIPLLPTPDLPAERPERLREGQWLDSTTAHPRGSREGAFFVYHNPFASFSSGADAGTPAGSEQVMGGRHRLHEAAALVAGMANKKGKNVSPVITP